MVAFQLNAKTGIVAGIMGLVMIFAIVGLASEDEGWFKVDSAKFGWKASGSAEYADIPGDTGDKLENGGNSAAAFSVFALLLGGAAALAALMGKKIPTAVLCLVVGLCEMMAFGIFLGQINEVSSKDAEADGAGAVAILGWLLSWIAAGISFTFTEA